MRKNYQRKARKSNHKFERGQLLLVRVPLPIAEVRSLNSGDQRGLRYN